LVAFGTNVARIFLNKRAAYDMSEVLTFPNRDEMIEKLIRAGYLQPTQRGDTDAIAGAIVQMKIDLRARYDRNHQK
jgi:hypothetical protein